jgi:hypothetical protein
VRFAPSGLLAAGDGRITVVASAIAASLDGDQRGLIQGWPRGRVVCTDPGCGTEPEPDPTPPSGDKWEGPSESATVADRPQRVIVVCPKCKTVDQVIGVAESASP